MKKKILIMGLPGSGKTTLAKRLQPILGAVWFNADYVRSNVYPDLGFSEEDRLSQASRMGALCDIVNASGKVAIADFICPIRACRKAFGADFTIFIDRIKEGRFEDTNRMFERPKRVDLVLSEGSVDDWVETVLNKLRVWDNQAPTALLIGRYQPFHDGHKELIREAVARTGQCLVAVRDTAGTDSKNPFSFNVIRRDIEQGCTEFGGKVRVVLLPNITDVFYGRNVGYNITEIVLPDKIQKISATDLRKGLRLGMSI